jgi:DNA-binding NarL/FixJ family response regulator
LKPLAVFVVEDSLTLREALVATLEELAPVRVIGVAAGAADALHVLEAEPSPCDLAIVDLFLAQGSGLDLLQALQKRRSPLRRVVLSNFATPAMRARCLALGAEQVFDKSTDIEALVAWCDALAAERCGAVLHGAATSADTSAPPAGPQ